MTHGDGPGVKPPEITSKTLGIIAQYLREGSVEYFFWDFSLKSRPVKRFRALVRPDPVSCRCCATMLRHDKRSLVKGKILRTAWIFRIQVLFWSARCQVQRHYGQVHNLTTVTCLENPAKAGTIILLVSILWCYRRGTKTWVRFCSS